MASFEAVVAEVLNVAIEDVTDDLGPATSGLWTSLRHVQLVSAVQRVYAVKLEPREIRAARNVGQLRELLRAKGVLE